MAKPMKSKRDSGSRAFKYRGRKRTAEDVSRSSKISGGSFDSYTIDGVNVFKPRDGENNIRILPSTWEDEETWGNDWAIILYVHYGVGADNSTYLCLEKMKGEDCPVCAARNDSEDEDEKKALRVTKRALCWIIDRDNEKAGPQAWSMPLTLFKDIQLRSIDKKTKAVIYLDDPDEGFDISFTKETQGGDSRNVKYPGVEVARDPTPISDNTSRQTRWLDAITNQPLPDILNYFDEEYLTKALEGKAAKRDDDDDSEDEDEEKPSRKRGKSTGKKSKPADDDDEDETEDEDEASEDDEDEDDARDERAARRNKRRVSRDEEEDDDDEEENEKPTRKRRSAKDDDDEESDDTDDDGEDDEESEEADSDSEEDEEDERPSRRRSSKRRNDDDEDEESEDEDTEDDDDEEPKSKAKSASARAKAKLAELKKKRGRR